MSHTNLHHLNINFVKFQGPTDRLLQVIILCLQYHVIISDLYKGSVGIVLCEEKCYYTVGCDSLTYKPDTLTCSGKKLDGNVITRHLQKTYSLGKHSTNCPTGSRIVISATKNPICSQRKDTNKRLSVNISRQKVKAFHEKGYKNVTWKNTLYLYKLYKDKMTWDDALIQCKEDGGLLAQLTEDFQWDWIRKNIEFPGFYLILMRDYIWVGLRYNPRSDNYEWVDGTVMTDGARWELGKQLKPQDYHNFSCVYMKANSRLVLMNMSCSTSYPFCCEARIELQ